MIYANLLIINVVMEMLRMLTAKTQKWLEENISAIRADPKNTYQKLLLALLDLPKRTRDDDRQISAIVRKMQADEAAKKAAERAKRTTARLSTKRRKERDHRMFDLAGLLVLTGFADGYTGMISDQTLVRFGDQAAPMLLGLLADLHDRVPSLSDDALQAALERGHAIMAEKKMKTGEQTAMNVPTKTAEAVSQEELRRIQKREAEAKELQALQDAANAVEEELKQML